ADSIQADVFYRLFPIERLLHQRFDSISKIGDLKVPLLVLHGTADSVVPVELGQKLYQSAPEPKSLFLIPEGDHVRIYAPREGSYIRAIARFVQSEMSLH
ncbi:MAG: alpha/beta hydrolase, partial [Cyanobacteria bacterium P01_D01_bin.44]